ncbi:two-component sensor histidine kinase, partial [Escherichia coli]
HVQVGLPSGGWLDVQADEGQAGMHAMPASLVVDYLLRLYLIRFVAVCAVAFVAVRFALKPLTQLARAAEA